MIITESFGGSEENRPGLQRIGSYPTTHALRICASHGEHLTLFEQQQPESTFMRAGRLAFRACFPPNANPYRQEPYRSLWDKGYAQSKYEYDGEFIRAGRFAYKAGLNLDDNPYRSGARRELWSRGWWKAKHNADDLANRIFRPQPRRNSPLRNVKARVNG